MCSAETSGLPNRKHMLLARVLEFVFPFLDSIVVDAAQGEEFFLVVDHFLAAPSGERVVLHQEDRLLRTDLLAIAAEDAAEHVDLEFPGHLLSVWPVGGLVVRSGRDDPDRLGWADEFAELAGNALRVALLVPHQVGRPAVAFGHDPLLFRILHRHFLAKKMTNRDLKPADDGGQIKPFPKSQAFSFYDH